MIKNYTQVSYEVRIKSSKLPLFQSLSLVKKSLMLFGKTCLIYSRKIKLHYENFFMHFCEICINMLIKQEVIISTVI